MIVNDSDSNRKMVEFNTNRAMPKEIKTQMQ